MVKVVRDGFAHIDKGGERLHTKVRYLMDDTGRVAVFLSPTEGPAVVYAPGEVTLTRVSASCSHPVCYGKASRQQLTNLWRAAEQ